jgi:hypothetical protein
MPVAFPLSLRTIIRQGKSRSQPAAFRLSEPRRGYAYVQATGTDTPVFWDITLKFTQPEAALFQLWFTQDLQRGVLEFTMPIRTEFGLVTHTCRFLPDSLLPVQEDGEVFVYTAQIMARAQIIPAPYLAGYPGGFAGPIPTQGFPVGASYSASLASYWTGGIAPLRYEVTSGALPVGLAINEATGVVSGAAATAGEVTGVVVTRTDAIGVQYSSNAFGFAVQPSDAAFASVALLMPFNGANGSTSFIDASSSGRVLVPSSGSPVISTAQSRWGGSSLYLGSSDDGIWTDSYTGVQFGTADFTVELWAYLTAGPGGDFLLVSCRNPSGSGRWALNIQSSRNFSLLIDGSNYANSSAVPLNEWMHLAVTRQGNTVRSFVNGTLSTTVSTFTGSISDTTSPLRIGNEPTFSGFAPIYIDDVRVTKGLARYTANFTPPTGPFPAF